MRPCSSSLVWARLRAVTGAGGRGGVIMYHGCRAAIFHNQQLERPQSANCYWTMDLLHWTLYLVLTTPSYSGDLAWTLPGHCLVKLTSFLDDGDDGVIGQVRLLMLVLLNKLSVRN